MTPRTTPLLTARLEMRLTEEDRDAFQLAAQKLGLTTMSAFLRFAGLHAALSMLDDTKGEP